MSNYLISRLSSTLDHSKVSSRVSFPLCILDGESDTAFFHCSLIYLSPFWNIHGCLAGWLVGGLVCWFLPPLLVKPHHRYLLLSYTTSTCLHRSRLEQCCDPHGAVQAFCSGRLPCRVPPRQLPGDREIWEGALASEGNGPRVSVGRFRGVSFG